MSMSNSPSSRLRSPRTILLNAFVAVAVAMFVFRGVMAHLAMGYVERGVELSRVQILLLEIASFLASFQWLVLILLAGIFFVIVEFGGSKEH